MRIFALYLYRAFSILEVIMATRIALIGIIVEKSEATERLNAILHEYAPYIVGRMGVPYRERGVAIISVIIDAENNVISALSGKLGQLDGVQIKTMYAKAGDALA